MRKRRIALSILSSVTLLVFGATLPQQTGTTQGQDRIPSSRRPACGCYVCGKLLAAPFPNKAPNCAGILAKDACSSAGGDLPAADRSTFCKQLQGSLSGGDFRQRCPAYAAMCGDTTPQKCEKPTPWFDNSTTPGSGCRDFQAPTVRVEAGTAYLQMCGSSVFAHQLPSNDTRIIETYKTLLLERVTSAFGSKICCDKFREATAPNSPCDPRFDLDCDGVPNPSDLSADGLYPDITLSTVATGVPSSNVDPLPPWVMKDYSKFVPPVKLCDCKWELLKGTRTCSPDGVRPHVYQARWRCPSTGNERFTRKEAPAYESCGPATGHRVGFRRYEDFVDLFLPYLSSIGDDG
ncbi:MAG TPA: hypothetical protein VNA22_02385 [Pyrinomonadaceae bacterium]|nr:hypothetical protein [Pyrinomonadaceae bacterium]